MEDEQIPADGEQEVSADRDANQDDRILFDDKVNSVEMLEIAKAELCLDIKQESVNGIASSVREELMMEKRAKSANIAKILDEGIQKSKNKQATASALHSQTNNDNKHDDIGDQHIWADHYCAYGGADDYGSLCIAWDAAGHLENWLRTDLHSVSTAHITIDASSSGIALLQSDYRRGSETRPVNTKVIWIMRVW